MQFLFFFFLFLDRYFSSSSFWSWRSLFASTSCSKARLVGSLLTDGCFRYIVQKSLHGILVYCAEDRLDTRDSGVLCGRAYSKILIQISFWWTTRITSMYICDMCGQWQCSVWVWGQNGAVLLSTSLVIFHSFVQRPMRGEEGKGVCVCVCSISVDTRKIEQSWSWGLGHS